MRRALGALLVTAILAALAAAEPPSDEQQLRALLDEFLAGASRGDARTAEAPRPDAPRTD